MQIIDNINSGKYNIIFYVIIIFFIFHLYTKKDNIEEFTDTELIDEIKKERSRIYLSDVEAIKTLADYVKLMTTANGFKFDTSISIPPNARINLDALSGDGNTAKSYITTTSNGSGIEIVGNSSIELLLNKAMPAPPPCPAPCPAPAGRCVQKEETAPPPAPEETEEVLTEPEETDKPIDDTVPEETEEFTNIIETAQNTTSPVSVAIFSGTEGGVFNNLNVSDMAYIPILNSNFKIKSENDNSIFMFKLTNVERESNKFLEFSINNVTSSGTPPVDVITPLIVMDSGLGTTIERLILGGFSIDKSIMRTLNNTVTNHSKLNNF